MKSNHGGFVSYIATAIIVAGLAVTVITGCSSTGSLAQQQAGYARDKVDARGLFVENCARCHGEDGHAKTFRGKLMHAQDFTDAKWHASAANDDIIRVIK